MIPSQSSKSYFNRLYTALLLIITVLSFAPVLKANFLNWDDDHLLTQNPLVHNFSGSNLLDIFQSTILKIYCPLSILSFNIEYQIFGLNAFYYHLNNLLLHSFIVILIFVFAKKLNLSPTASFFAALIFAVHPMHVESVAWISERKDVLYGFFYMLSLNMYLKYIDTHKISWYALTFIFGLLSLLAKPMALSLPFILCLCDIFKNRTLSTKLILEKIGILAYVIPIAGITWKEQGRVDFEFQIFEECLKIIWIFIFYIKKFFIPDFFTFFYMVPTPATLMNPAYLSTTFIFIVLIWSLIRFRKNRLFVFANLFYFLSIFFTLRRVQLQSPGGDLFYSIEDRFMYLPSLGFCLWIGFILHKTLQHYSKTNRIQYALTLTLTCLVLLQLAVKTYNQSRLWKNSLSLWNSVLIHHPNSPIALTNRGIVQPKAEDALLDYSKSLALDPKSPETYFNRAFVYKELNKPHLAYQDLNHVVDLMTNADSKTYYQRPELTVMLENTYTTIEDLKKQLNI